MILRHMIIFCIHLVFTDNCAENKSNLSWLVLSGLISKLESFGNHEMVNLFEKEFGSHVCRFVLYYNHHYFIKLVILFLVLLHTYLLIIIMAIFG